MTGEGGGPDDHWEFDIESVRRLAEVVDGADPNWTRPGLAAATAGRLEPARAEEIAGRILGAFPREPVDRRAALIGFFATLRPLAPAVVPATNTETDALLDELASGPLPRRQPLWAAQPPIESLDELSRMLNLRPAELDWFADHGRWLRTRTGPLQHYRVQYIPKTSGLRMLEIPKPRLREIQRTLLRHIVSPLEPHAAAHGFRKGRSAATFAEPHAGAAVVLRIDLRDFFPSVGVAQVRAIFATIGYPPPVAAALADLCTTATSIATLSGIDSVLAGSLRRRHLPQGSPTSPALSNLALRNADRRIAGYAAKRGLQYTRYADDLALSGGRMAVERALWVVSRIVADEGFPVHQDKVRVMRAHQRQHLAGLVVNDRPQASRLDYDNLRALLHNCAITGAPTQNRQQHHDFRAFVYGRIAWVGATNADRRRTLLGLASQVNWLV
ncbi:MAG: reverse transcriptase family protein [Nakamurella sp.]